VKIREAGFPGIVLAIWKKLCAGADADARRLSIAPLDLPGRPD
jgi:hypothetical protein